MNVFVPLCLFIHVCSALYWRDAVLNLWLQILLGFAPFVIISLVTMMWRRFYTRYTIISTSASLVIVVVCSFMLFTTPSSHERLASSDQMDDWYMLGVYMLEGNLKAAESMLDELYAGGIYDERYSLYKARLELLKGRVDQAAVLYAASQKTSEKQDHKPYLSEEFEMLKELVAPASDIIRDEALYRYLEQQGIQPAEYGVVKWSATALHDSADHQAGHKLAGAALGDSDDLDGSPSPASRRRAGLLSRPEQIIHEHIRSELREMRESSPVLKELDTHVNLILETNDLFDQFVDGEEPDSRALQKVIRRFEELQDKDNIALRNKELRLARLKAMLMGGKLRQIPGMIGNDPDLNELIVLSELYVSRLANRSDFHNFISDEQREAYEKVIRQAEKVYEEQYQDESRRVRNQVMERINTLRDETRHLPLAEIRNRISELVKAREDRERSKVYLHLAKIENFLGNEVKSDDAMNQALTSAVYSTDSQYAEPMRKIMEVIQDKADSEEIKNVPEYVESAVNRSLPLPVHRTAKAEETRQSEETGTSFEQYFTEYVSKKRAELTIGMIDTSQFPYIEARVQLSHDLDTDDIASLLEVYDQGIRIEDFTFEKLDFDSTRIMLLTDNSGSMSGALHDLKVAVEQFIMSMNDGEQVSIVTFTDRIEMDSGFLDDTDALLATKERLQANGWTAIYNSLLYGINQFPDDLHSHQVIILMTDGLDNNKASEELIRTTIGARSIDKGITVYAIGLSAEVDTEYLELIAHYGNGSFIYASDPASLRSFYDFIHRQSVNQYVLRYRAQNTVDPSRELTIRIPQTNSQDTKKYQLYDDAEPSFDDDALLHDHTGKVRLYGLDKKLLYRSSNRSTEVMLRGIGFSEMDHFAISFRGTSEYAIADAKVIDDEKIMIRLPEHMAIGTYDLIFLADGNRHILPDEFELAIPGSRETIRFGPYTLTANEIIQEDDRTYRLKGRVRLNDYIQFRGEVKLQGDPKEDLRIRLTDLYGASITYDPQSSTGLARMMAMLGINLDFSSLGTFDLYYDERHLNDFDSYTVDRIGSRDKHVKLWGVTLNNSSLYIYPDHINIDFNRIVLKVPYQDELLRYRAESPFVFDNRTSARITPTSIALVADMKVSRKDGLKSFSIGKLPMNLNEVSASINTLKHNYDIAATVDLSTARVKSVGLDLGVKGGRFDKVMLHLDIPFTIARTPVPITVRNFAMGVQDMSKVPQEAGFKETLLGSYLTGSLDVQAGNIADYLPFLRNLLPDKPLLQLSKTTVKARLRDISLLFSTNIDLFGKITLASVDVKMGHFDYSNYLLNIPEQEVTGFFIETSQNFKWDTEKIKFDYSGAISLTFNDAASGLQGYGSVNYDIDWFFIRSEQNYYGNVWVGVHSPGGKSQFTILIKETDLKNNDERGGRLVFREGSIIPRFTLY